MISAFCAIPLRDGFDPRNTITLRDCNSGSTSVTADVLNERDLTENNLFLFGEGESGINLLKIHGSLDVFAFREGLDLCRLRPSGPGIKSRLETLRVINTRIGFAMPPGARPLNEIAALDEDGVIQFLRRSLLAGANKFNRRFHRRFHTQC
jgi:hypothetical protein